MIHRISEIKTQGSNMHQLHFSNLTLRLTQWDQYASGSTGIIDDTGLLIVSSHI